MLLWSCDLGFAAHLTMLDGVDLLELNADEVSRSLDSSQKKRDIVNGAIER